MRRYHVATVAAVLAALLLAAHAEVWTCPGNLVKNPSFEDKPANPPIPGTTGSDTDVASYAHYRTIPFWNSGCWASLQQEFELVTTPNALSGGVAAELGVTTAAAVCQEVYLRPGGQYRLSFGLRARDKT